MPPLSLSCKFSPAGFAAIGVAITTIASACGNTNTTQLLLGAESQPRAQGQLQQSLSFVTFNTALGVGLADYPEQRLAALEEALPALQADVLCLQEVWDFADVEQLADALLESHPYAHYSVAAATAEGTEPACSASEADTLIECITDNCSEASGPLLPICVVASCRDLFFSVADTCQACIIANQELNPSDITEICSSADGNANAFTEQNGLLLLSNLPLSDLAFQPLDSSLGDRGILAARLDVSDSFSAQVLCSHLTPAFNGIPYSGEYGDWAGEQDYHIEEMLRLAASRSEGLPTVLLGDMNCGPATNTTPAVREDAFGAFAEAGYSSPYAEVEVEAPRCTFCADNLLGGNGGDNAEDEGAIIDHVLLSGWDPGLSVAAERILDEPLEIVVAGEPQDTAYSDHYGVQLQMDPSKTESP